MKFLSRRDIPISLSGKTGWPWTEEIKPLPSSQPDGSPWPKISIVTPSFNQALYLEETIRSVLLQGYPNLEYIIIDGGSRDGSVEIIKKYEPWLTYWVSELDRGQSHAINKGFVKSTGEIMAWINSDDYYALGAFAKVVEAFSTYDIQWVAGNCKKINLDGKFVLGSRSPMENFERWFLSCPYAQPGVFWRRALWENAGGVDESLKYSFDYDLWMKFSRVQLFAHWTDQPLAYFRLQPQSKTVTSRLNFDKEDWIVFRRNQYRIKNIFKRIFLQFRRREKSANRYLSKNDFSLPPWRKIIKGLMFAPWYLFKIRFYRNVLAIVFSKS